MSKINLIKDKFRKGAAKPGRRLPGRKPAVYVGASLGALVLVVAVFFLVFGNAILNHYGKEKVERAFTEAYPGSVLQIGKMNYSLGANRLVAQSATLSATDTTLKVGRVSLTGVRWGRLLWGKATLTDALARAGLEAADLDVEFARARYGIRCARLQASVSNSALIAEGAELRTLVEDKVFFAASKFRTTRFHIVAPECKVSGLAFGEWLQGKSYRAGSVHFSRPSFEALVNIDKPSAIVKSRRMVHEALASLRRPLQVDSLTVTDGLISYQERPVAGSAPGILTFGAVSLSAEGIANRGDAAAAIKLRAQGDFMNAGTLKVRMSIPIASPDFSLHYSGSLTEMDLAGLSAFLDVVEHIRIKSGHVQEAAFEIDVAAGRASGHVRTTYWDLVIAVLDLQTGNERGFASFMANLFKIRNSNGPSTSASMKEGKVDYTRKPDDTFLGFIWAALRSGVLDIIGH